MLKTLRNRLILSHILPPLIIIPLMGVLLIYTVESFILLPTLTSELNGDAQLLAEIFRSRPETWQNPETAAAALLSASPELDGRVMLLDSEGQILASSDQADSARKGTVPAIISELTPEEARQPYTRTDYSSRLNDEAIDIIVPVFDSEQALIGRVRITHHYETVYQQLFQFRFLLGGILLVAFLLSAAIGYILALNISTPIQYVAEAIYDVATGQQQEPLTLAGPEEINLQIQAVNFLVARLNSLEKARQQLLANLVHELGRPLGALRSALQALMRGASQDRELLEDLLRGMDEKIERMQILLDELAHIHDQVLGTLELAREPLDMSRWLPQVLRPWQEVAREKNQRFELIIPDDLPPVTADPTRLAQAVDNLVSNAIKYTDQKGKITVSAVATADEVVLRVSDSGPGISAADQEQIFEPFYRGDQQRRIIQGMGLGLSIARDLIVAHGGHLELESQPGKGSQFSIFIPRSVVALESLEPPLI